MLGFVSKTWTNRACPLLFYSVLVSNSVFTALSTVFYSINSPDNSPFSHPVLPFLGLHYWPFQLSMKVSLSPDIILCGWLGLKHKLTNKLQLCPGTPRTDRSSSPETVDSISSVLSEAATLHQWQRVVICISDSESWFASMTASRDPNDRRRVGLRRCFLFGFLCFFLFFFGGVS